MSPGAFDASKVSFHHIVFDGPPSPEMPRFIEVEDGNGRSCCVGEWHQREDGLWELLIPRIEWFGMDSAPKDREILIRDGSVEYDGSLHGEIPFKGVVIACWNDCGWHSGWQGPNCGGHDEFAWHKPECWTHIPARSSVNVPDAPAVVQPAEPFCDDEGCPHHGTPHVCVPPAGGEEDDLSKAIESALVVLRTIAKDRQKYGPYATQAQTAAWELSTAHRSASQATRDEVIEACARVADAIALETKSTGLARLDKDDRSSATIGECYECEAVAAEDVAERIRALKQGGQE